MDRITQNHNRATFSLEIQEISRNTFGWLSSSSSPFLLVFKKGLQLPGSRMDVLRKQSVPGPSPVGGSKGGTDSTTILELDEFELQAANYNMACASAQLGLLNEAVEYLRVAFENGFDNYSTVRGDPDIDPIKGTAGFDKLMEEYDPKKKGFNPFGFLGMS